MEKELRKIIDELQEKNKELEESVRKLEMKISFNENSLSKLLEHIVTIKRVSYFLFWISLIILFGIIILLGSE